MALRFVHAADLHLDSPFVGVDDVDAEVGEVLRTATFRAFDNVVDLCLRQGVDFLLVAGDVYDGADRSLRAQLAFRDGLQRLSRASIRSYVVHGNHDPLDGWSSRLAMPDEVHVFAADGVQSIAHERDGRSIATIHGHSFPHRDVRTNLAESFRADGSGVFQIGLLHCNVGGDTRHEPYAPCTFDSLAGSGMDYWALGHVHSQAILCEQSPTVVYPGNPQGRHIAEAGPRGCYLIQVDDVNRVKAEFVPVDNVRWGRERLSVEGLETDESLLAALEESLLRLKDGASGRPCICRLELTGRGPLHAALGRAGYVEQLRDRLRQYGRGLDPLVWVDAVERRTRPPVDLESRRQAEDFLGDCLRLLSDYRERPELRAALTSSLDPLFQDSRVRSVLATPDDRALLALLDDVESLCVDKLFDGGDE